MKAQTVELRQLNWKQPYADLMLLGKIETRKWHTSWRGRVLIVASKIAYTPKQLLAISGPVQYDRIQDKLGERAHLLGQALAVADLVDCRPMLPSEEDACFVQYRPWLFAHIYKNVRRIKPFQVKGVMGFKGLDPRFEEQIQYL